MQTNRCVTTLTILGLLSCAGLAAAESRTDWPQFRGPNRDGRSPETGLLAQWPAEGPKVLWKVPLGDGFAGVSITGDRLFTNFTAGADEVVAAFSATDGKEIWRVRLGASLSTEMGNGPRSTPTYDRGTVYAVGSDAILLALAASDGKEIWRVDFKERFGSRMPQWGLSVSPLVDGDLVLVDVGGEKASYAALDRASGKTVWTALESRMGYSSPLIATLNGVKQYVFVPSGAQKIVSLLPDGSVYWTSDWPGGTLAMPLQIGDDGIFVSASGDVGAVRLRVRLAEGKPVVEEVWRNREMKNEFSSSVYHEGHIYGFDNATLKCIDATTGERKWVYRGFGQGSLILADGKLFVLSDRGKLAMVDASPAGYQERGFAQILGHRTWAAPALAGGKLFVRDATHMVCLDLKS